MKILTHIETMSKISIIFQLIKKSIFKPRLILELAQEKAEVDEDQKYKTHQYEYDFNSIEEYFQTEFPDVDIQNFEKELSDIDEYAENFLKKLEKKTYPSKEKPYPTDYSISSDSRKFLYLLCRIVQPRNIIETGVAYGLSSLYILSAMNKNNSGNLYSIDSIFRPWQSKEMIGAIIPEKLQKRWKLILGKSNLELDKLFNKIDDVEIFIHDSLHTYKNMTFEFDCAINKINKNGIIISDDILDNDAFYNFTKNKKRKKYVVKVNNVAIGLIQNN